MSFNITGAGQGIEAAQSLKAKIDVIKQYDLAASSVLEAGAVLAAEIAILYPKQILGFEFQGHVNKDGPFGNVSFITKVY